MLRRCPIRSFLDRKDLYHYDVSFDFKKKTSSNNYRFRGPLTGNMMEIPLSIKRQTVVYQNNRGGALEKYIQIIL